MEYYNVCLFKKNIYYATYIIGIFKFVCITITLCYLRKTVRAGFKNHHENTNGNSDFSKLQLLTDQ